MMHKTTNSLFMTGERNDWNRKYANKDKKVNRNTSLNAKRVKTVRTSPQVSENLLVEQ